VVRECADAGLPITGKGEELTQTLAGMVGWHTAVDGHLSDLAAAVKGYRREDGALTLDTNGRCGTHPKMC